jgi:hypothetical protein
MKKPAPRRDKYFLRDLHQEIDLYDRKLAYLNKYVDFASNKDRDEAEKRLLARRAPLEKAARDLIASGIEFEDKDLPRSFRTERFEQGRARRNLFLVGSAYGVCGYSNAACSTNENGHRGFEVGP